VAEIRDLKDQHQNLLTAQSTQAAAQAEEIRNVWKLVTEMQAGLLKLQSKDSLVAQR
jgi:hypothetical protein